MVVIDCSSSLSARTGQQRATEEPKRRLSPNSLPVHPLLRPPFRDQANMSQVWVCPPIYDLDSPLAPDNYGRTVSKVAVAQICEGVGFEGIKKSTMEALSDIAVRYICDLGKSATLYASLAGRSEVNIFDLVKGLEDLSSTSGFSGVNNNRCVMSKGIFKEIVEFVDTMEENPFAQPIPQFPVTKFRQGIPSFSEMGEVPSGKHIPEWLPAFPDPHTYVHSPMWNERKTDPRTDKVEQVRQRRKAERSLLSLQQRLLSNGLAGPGPSGSGNGNNVNVEENGLGAHVAGKDQNPFLVPPLQAGGEKDVSNSTVVLPAKLEGNDDKKRVSVLETFGVAIDAMKAEASSSDPMGLDRRVVTPDKRPVVHFKLKAGKKMLVEDLDVNLRSQSNERRKSSWFGRDDEKDDKKRRAELILRQSMDNNNPQELSQM